MSIVGTSSKTERSAFLLRRYFGSLQYVNVYFYEPLEHLNLFTTQKTIFNIFNK